MNHDIGAMLDRAAEKGTGEGVVDHERQAVLVRDFSHRADIEDIDARIADGFAVEHFGFGRNGLAEVLRVGGIDEDHIDPPMPQGDIELRVGPTIERRGGDDLVARGEQGGQRNELRGLSGTDRQRADSSFERGNPLFEGGIGRIHDAAVDISESLQGEELGGVVGVLEDVGGRLIERHRARAGGGIGALAGVYRQGVESEDVVVLGSFFVGGIRGIGQFAVLRVMGVFQDARPDEYGAARDDR